ncbi:GNAT family N-acetyltransferase [Paenibacillus tianjinensis]|uniref:GNAT family N-acetyltransferase n=1 Tax=Paenibacillus tianjinensis TaxID=2810347 RepID=A0ABX7LJ57_9BACL|nr:GNAT family protein [Paenibacillus tianjinensis]QSF47014.1 GNAT family N-acetyltransferase [Paenibacillus tianjinensis]
MLLRNGTLIIRQAVADDAQILCNWWNDGLVMAHAGFPNGLGITVDEVVDNLSSGQEHHRRYILDIAGIPAGEMSCRQTAPHTVEIGIKICLLHQQNQGYGTAFLKMLIRYLFKEQGIHTIQLDTNLKNYRAQHVYKKIGFRECAVHYDTRRNQLGELQSFIDYELTNEDYLEHPPIPL